MFLRVKPQLPRVVVRQAFRSYAADTGGAVGILAAFLFPVLIGGAGLGAETGYWYFKQRDLQHAADVAAHAAGVRKRAGDSKTKIDAAALRMASASGFSLPIGQITVNTPPTTGDQVGNKNSAEVIVTQHLPRLFSSIYSHTPVLIKARAVAHISGGSKACVLALSPSQSAAVNVSGSATLALGGCDVASNSLAADAFLLSGSSASLSTGCVYTVGQATVTTRLTLTTCDAIRENAPVVLDPYASVPQPAVTGTCRNKNVGTPTTATTLTPTETDANGVPLMRFCGGLDLKGQVTFNPGIYIIDGGSFTMNGGSLNSTSNVQIAGSGVTFFLANGARLNLAGNVFFNVSAPTGGPYSGLLFFGGREATGVSHKLAGTSGSVLQGAIYVPASDIQFSGNSAASGGCTQIIGNTVTFTGTSSLKSSCASAGTKDILESQTVKLVE